MQKHLSLFVLLLSSLPLLADWHPVVYNHTPQTYGGGTQNWQLAQSATTGWIYTANNYGLLEFDGVDWRLRGIHNSTVLRSVFIGGDDRVYVGGSDEFGVFCPSEYHERIYHPLSDEIPETYRPFGEVWSIHQRPNGNLYFQTHRYIFETDTAGHLVQVIQPGSMIYKTLLRGDNLYMATDIGIYLYTASRIHRLNGPWREGTVVSAMAHWGDRLMIATDFDGLYEYSGDGVKPFHTEIDDWLHANQLYSIATDDSQLALGTVTQGIALIDTEGKLIRFLNRERGLQNNTILSLLYDRDHNLWVGEDLGIDHVSLLWPTEYLGLSEPCGVGYAYCESGGYCYLGTNQGLYYLHRDQTPVPVPHTAGQVWRLQQWDGALFCCHNRGLVHIAGTEASLIDVPVGVWSICPIDAQYAYAFSYNGVYLIEHTADGYRCRGHLSGYSETMYRAAMDRWGRIWAISSRGVVCLTPDEARTSVACRLCIEETNRSHYSIIRVEDDVLIISHNAILTITEAGEWAESPLWSQRLTPGHIYSAAYPFRKGYIAVYGGGVCYGDRTIFDLRDFYIGGFDNAYLTPDSAYVVVGGTTGFYRIRLDLALTELPNHPWAIHEKRIIIPWWRTWWAILIYALVLTGIIILIIALVRNMILRHDERLAREREQEIHRQQVRILQLENDKARYELEEKSHQLNHALLGRVNRNEIISWVQQDLRRIADALQKGDLEQAKRLVRQTEGKLYAGNKRQDKDWENFEESFDVLNPEFVAILRRNHPDLTEQEIKLCVYIQQGLLTKEIGPLLHLSTRGVEMMRYRMHAKMGLESQVTLKKYFESLKY